MAWFVLVVSGLFEAVWATALGRIAGWGDIRNISVFTVGMVISMTGLAWAMRSLPTGTSYAVWVGIGAVATVGVAALLGDEHLRVAKVFFLVVIIGGVIGLKTVGCRPSAGVHAPGVRQDRHGLQRFPGGGGLQ